MDPRTVRVRARLATAGAVALTLLLASSTLAVTWSSQVRVPFGATREGVVNGHATAAVGSTVHVLAWTDSSVGYDRSTNAGTGWDTAVTIATKTASITYTPVGIAASGDLVVAVYKSKGPGNARALLMRRSVDNGVTWDNPVKVSSYSSADNDMGDGDVAVAGKDVYVVWTARTTGKVYLRRSTDSGATLKPAQNIGTTASPFISGKEGEATVAASGKNAYIAWIPSADDKGIELLRSTDSGATWKPKQVLSSAGGSYIGPSASASGKTVLVSYNLSSGVVRVARSTNSGTSFSSSTVAPASDSTKAYDVVIVGGQARLSLVGDLPYVWVRSSANGGGTWAARSQAAPYGDTPNVTIAGGTTVVNFNIGAGGFSALTFAVHD